MYPLAKKQVTLNRVSAASEDCVLQETGNDSSDDDNIPLAKQAFSSWSDSDSDVSLSVLR